MSPCVLRVLFIVLVAVILFTRFLVVLFLGRSVDLLFQWTWGIYYFLLMIALGLWFFIYVYLFLSFLVFFNFLSVCVTLHCHMQTLLGLFLMFNRNSPKIPSLLLVRSFFIHVYHLLKCLQILRQLSYYSQVLVSFLGCYNIKHSTCQEDQNDNNNEYAISSIYILEFTFPALSDFFSYSLIVVTTTTVTFSR